MMANSNQNLDVYKNAEILSNDISSKAAILVNSYKNRAAGRRDSLQVWVPLLENGVNNKIATRNGVGSGMGDGNQLLPANDNRNYMNRKTHVINNNNNNQHNNHNISNHDNGGWINRDTSEDEELGSMNEGDVLRNYAEMPSLLNDNHLNVKNLINDINDKSIEEVPLYKEQQQQLHNLSSLHLNDIMDEMTLHNDFPIEIESDATFSRNIGCGLFGYRPKWAQNLATTNIFMIVFLMAYVLQGMYMTYFVSVITTIEKLFQIKSKTTGFLLSASEMGQISTALLLTYFAGRGHRPRWIACGMALFSVAAFACAIPHFIFSQELIESTQALSRNHIYSQDLQQEASFSSLPSTTTLSSLVKEPFKDFIKSNLTELREFSVQSSSAATKKYTNDFNLCLTNKNIEDGDSDCNEDHKLRHESQSKITIITLCILFVSLLSSGIGQTAIATLGIPYIDDNVSSKQSPMYMAITIGVRILGPASGFIVGSLCTRWYVDFSNPGFGANDPRWIGAWWLGPILIGTIMLVSSVAMFAFPKQIESKKKAGTTPLPISTTIISSDEIPTTTTVTLKGHKHINTIDNGLISKETKPKLKDFPKTLRRQLSNDILMFRTASCVFHLLPISGLYIFLPKYLETQFRIATYDANMIAAFCGILVMGVGIVTSGMVIFKIKPNAKSVAAWIALTAIIYASGMIILMFVGCNMNEFAGYIPSIDNKAAIIEPSCEAAMNCACDTKQFAPICGVDGKIYLSSCHAGCSQLAPRDHDEPLLYMNCTCIDKEIYNINEPYDAYSGYCENDCRSFYVFLAIFVICVFMHSTSEVGSMLLVMRCTHPKDKSMAMGVIQSAIGLFGNVPCPIIYGAVVDSACLMWKTVCGKNGACSLYDPDRFRQYYLGITACIMFLAFIMDIVVWCKAHRIDIDPDEQNNEDKTSINIQYTSSSSVKP